MLAGHKFGGFEPTRYPINFGGYDLVNPLTFIENLPSGFFFCLEGNTLTILKLSKPLQGGTIEIRPGLNTSIFSTEINYA